jgi:hypothetical protein
MGRDEGEGTHRGAADSLGSSYIFSIPTNDFNLYSIRTLKEQGMDGHSSSYLLNLSSFDEGMEKIFGKPQKVIDYANPLDHNGRNRWGCGYWWKFPF